MATTSQVRDWWADHRCTYGTSTHMFGRTPVYAQNTDWVRALEAAHLGAGYKPTSGGFIGSRRDCPAGISGRECQSDGDWCSLHNYGLAWDVEYNHNPHLQRRLSESDLWGLFNTGKTKYNPDIVSEILETKNTHGEPLFRWLGFLIGDTMHWEITVPPERSTVDWSTVPDYEGVDHMALSKGAKGISVEFYQNGLLAWDVNALPKFGADSDFGTETEEWVRTFQSAHDLASNGIIDGLTADMVSAYSVNGETEGEKGDKGDTGEQGEKGDTGATGADGADGTVHPGTVLELSNRAVVTEVT